MTWLYERTFNEAALGYKPHLEAELKSSEEIPLPEELGGGEIMIKNITH